MVSHSKLIPDRLPAVDPHLVAQSRIPCQSIHGLGQRMGIMWGIREQNAGVLGNEPFPYSAHIMSDDGAPGGHGFQAHQPKGLRKEGWHQDDLGIAVDLFHSLRIQPSRKRHTMAGG